jgi:L-2,4-diaminobutyrate transaminase
VIGDYLQETLKRAFADHDIVGEVRGVGMLAALEFAPGKSGDSHFPAGLAVGARVSAACIENGLIARAMPHGDILGFAPPLICTREDIDDIVARAKRAVDKIAAELSSSGPGRQS